jgi:hypothetical protein
MTTMGTEMHLAVTLEPTSFGTCDRPKKQTEPGAQGLADSFRATHSCEIIGGACSPSLLAEADFLVAVHSA